jgi:hypothetical protein
MLHPPCICHFLQIRKQFEDILFFNLLAIRINTFYGLICWCRTNIISPSGGRIRAPPAKRPLLLHLRSIGKRRFSLRLFCFSRGGCRGVLGCASKRWWCLVLLSCKTSLMNGTPRSLWSVQLDTYRGASAIDRSARRHSTGFLESDYTYLCRVWVGSMSRVAQSV